MGLAGGNHRSRCGDRVSQFCPLDAAGEIAEEGRLHTNAASIEKYFAKLPAAVIALEAGTQSGWMARLLRRLAQRSRYIYAYMAAYVVPEDLAA